MDLLDEKRYGRAISCNNFSSTSPVVEMKEYLTELKSDWDIRAIEDPSSFVCAKSHATEEEIQNSGSHDFTHEFLPRIPTPVKVCLEIGCGFGRITQFIAQVSEKVIAVDISSKLLGIARERLAKHSNITFLETDGMTLNGVPDNSVDVAFEYICFQHIPSQHIIISYIQEVAKKLVVGGRFVMHGRDVKYPGTGTNSGNTWHGCGIGTDLVRSAIDGTSLEIEKTEGEETERFWATLIKAKEIT